MTNRNSFLLYTDRLEILDELSDEDAGKLFKAVVEYVKNGSEPPRGTLTSIAFRGVKNGIDVATENYKKLCLKNRDNGKKGGRPKTEKANGFESKEEKPSGYFGIEKETQKTLTKTDTKTKTDVTTPCSRSNGAGARATAGSGDLPISQTENIELSEYFIEQLKETYPQIDIGQTLQEIRLKLIATGYPCDNENSLSKYVVSWFRNLSIAEAKRRSEQSPQLYSTEELEKLNAKIQSISADDI